MSNIAEFDRLMKIFYRDKSERVERENNMLWTMCIDLLSAILKEESGGRKVIDLQDFATGKLKEIMQILEFKRD